MTLGGERGLHMDWGGAHQGGHTAFLGTWREESGSSGMLRSELRREVVGGATLEHLNQRWWVREGAQDGWRTALSLQALLVCSRGPFLPP